jgi:hypothetical protein
MNRKGKPMEINFGESKSVVVDINGVQKHIYKKTLIDEFNSNVLKIGSFQADSETIRCISAVFDLEGFTYFCSQTEPELYAGRFLKDFFDWLFNSIKIETINETFNNGYELFHDLPFYSKFLGDGVLFLWDTLNIGEITQHNLLVSLSNICDNYTSQFYPTVKDKYIGIPKRLRCGVAKGSVYSIGERKDFIGPCINLASRLQSLPGVTFAFSRKGFNPEAIFEDYSNIWVKKQIVIRGYNFNEIIVIPKLDFMKMSEEDKTFYKDF